jgi:hypothetical protein
VSIFFRGRQSLSHMSRPEDLKLRRRLREEAHAIQKDKSLQASGLLLTVEMALEVAGDAKATAADKVLPLTLLWDLLEYTPLERCPEVIEVMERCDQQIRRCLDAMPAKLALLQMFRRMTARLCSSKDTVLAGRLMLVLANFFDMYERSGLNLQGEINSIETPVEPDGATPSPLADGDGPLTKYDFYALFWGFQEYFSLPNQLADRLPKFESSLLAILREFDNNLRFDGEEGSSWSLYSPSSLSSHPETSAESSIVSLPKYLSSRRLMHLQLRDGTFRRYILVQVLILLHSAQHYKQGKELTPSQRSKIEDLQAQTLQCLRKIPPNGEVFATCVMQALKRETVWIQWKLDRCPDVKSNKGVEGASLLLEEHLKGKAAIPEPKWHRMGNPALSRLWAEHDVPPEQMCRLQRKGPSPETFLQEYKEQLAPGSGVEPMYHLSKNRLYVWRALRLVSRRSLESFCKSVQTSGDKSTSEMFEKVIRDLEHEAKQAAREEDVQVLGKPGARSRTSPLPGRDDPPAKKGRTD